MIKMIHACRPPIIPAQAQVQVRPVHSPSRAEKFGKFYESFSICLLLALMVFIINLKLFRYLEKRIVLYL